MYGLVVKTRFGVWGLSFTSPHFTVCLSLFHVLWAGA